MYAAVKFLGVDRAAGYLVRTAYDYVYLDERAKDAYDQIVKGGGWPDPQDGLSVRDRIWVVHNAIFLPAKDVRTRLNAQVFCAWHLLSPKPRGSLPEALLRRTSKLNRPVAKYAGAAELRRKKAGEAWAEQLGGFTEEFLSSPAFDGFYRDLGRQLLPGDRQRLWKMALECCSRSECQYLEDRPETHTLLPLWIKLEIAQHRRTSSVALTTPELAFKVAGNLADKGSALFNKVYEGVVETKKHYSLEDWDSQVRGTGWGKGILALNIVRRAYLRKAKREVEERPSKQDLRPTVDLPEELPPFPTGVWIEIAKHLSPTDILNAMESWKSWWDKIDRPNFWKSVCPPHVKDRSREGFTEWVLGDCMLLSALVTRLERLKPRDHSWRSEKVACGVALEMIETSAAWTKRYRKIAHNPQLRDKILASDVQGPDRHLAAFAQHAALLGPSLAQRLEWNLTFGLPVQNPNAFGDKIEQWLEDHSQHATDSLTRCIKDDLLDAKPMVRQHRLEQVTPDQLTRWVPRTPDAWKSLRLLWALTEMSAKDKRPSLFGPLPTVMLLLDREGDAWENEGIGEPERELQRIIEYALDQERKLKPGELKQLLALLKLTECQPGYLRKLIERARKAERAEVAGLGATALALCFRASPNLKGVNEAIALESFRFVSWFMGEPKWEEFLRSKMEPIALRKTHVTRVRKFTKAQNQLNKLRSDRARNVLSLIESWPEVRISYEEWLEGLEEVRDEARGSKYAAWRALRVTLLPLFTGACAQLWSQDCTDEQFEHLCGEAWTIALEVLSDEDRIEELLEILGEVEPVLWELEVGRAAAKHLVAKKRISQDQADRLLSFVERLPLPKD